MEPSESLTPRLKVCPRPSWLRCRTLSATRNVPPPRRYVGVAQPGHRCQARSLVAVADERVGDAHSWPRPSRHRGLPAIGPRGSVEPPVEARARGSGSSPTGSTRPAPSVPAARCRWSARPSLPLPQRGSMACGPAATGANGQRCAGSEQADDHSAEELKGSCCNLGGFHAGVIPAHLRHQLVNERLASCLTLLTDCAAEIEQIRVVARWRGRSPGLFTPGTLLLCDVRCSSTRPSGPPGVGRVAVMYFRWPGRRARPWPCRRRPHAADELSAVGPPRLLCHRCHLSRHGRMSVADPSSAFEGCC